MGERIRVLEWQPDDPYPRAVVEVWPDEPGAVGRRDAIRDVEDRMIGAVRADRRPPVVREVNRRDIVVGADASGDAAMWLYALASRVPMGQADRYAVLAAPTVGAQAGGAAGRGRDRHRDGRVPAVGRLDE